MPDVNSNDILKRAEYERVTSRKFMDEHITPHAADLAYEYTQVLRKHLKQMFDSIEAEANFEYCLYQFGRNMEEVLKASLLLKTKVAILSPVTVSWPASGAGLDRAHMKELTDAGNKNELFVTMSILPVLVNKEKTESISKAVVCCHTATQQGQIVPHAGV